MVKLVDTPASGVGDASRGGSSPLLGTKHEKSPVTQVTGLFVLGLFIYFTVDWVAMQSIQIKARTEIYK